MSADPQVWRQALPVDPSLGEYPEASEVRPGLFTRFVPVAGQDGQLPPIQTTSVSERPPTPPGRASQALKRLVFGPPLDAGAIAVERMRKLVALPVLSADALPSVAYGPRGGHDRRNDQRAAGSAQELTLPQQSKAALSGGRLPGRGGSAPLP